MKKYLEILRLTKAQGLKGEFRAKVMCDSPDLIETFSNFYLGEQKQPTELKIRGIRKDFVIVKLDGIDNIDDTVGLIGAVIYVDREDFQLPDDTWFIADLIGLDVIDADSSKLYGTVEDILQNAPKDVYVVKTPDRKQLLFPAIPEVLIDVDIDGRVIKIRPFEGLFE